MSESRISKSRLSKSVRSTRAVLLAGLGLTSVLASAQNVPAPAPALNLIAVTANVAGAPDNIRINLQRWSTDAERDKLMAAWNMTATEGKAGGGGRAPAAGRGPAGRAGGRGGRGAAPPDAAADPTPDPDAVDDPNIGFAARYKVEESTPATPEASLAAALK